MKIWVNTLVKNEEKYLWYAVMSVINYVDKIIIWDTGSSDKTQKIIRELKNTLPNKIDFKYFGEITSQQFPLVRQKMLEKTLADWVIVLDGDEVWWEDSIRELTENIRNFGERLDSIVNRYFTLVGDIYHFQAESAGKYEIDDERGHINIRAMNLHIRGLHAAKPHGQQGYFDFEGKLIQNRNSKRRLHLKKPAYLHFTNMSRSSYDKAVVKRPQKLKYEIGESLPFDFYYPEVFFKKRPEIVDCVWGNMETGYYLKSIVMTPLKHFRRKFIKIQKSGY